MHRDTSETPFQGTFPSDGTGINREQEDSDCPFGGSAFSLLSIPPVSEESVIPSYLKIAEEKTQAEIAKATDEETEKELLLNEDYKVNNGVIIHILSGKRVPDQEIEKLSLSVRAYNALRRAGIKTITQLAALTIPELHSIKNLGKNTAKEIIESLHHFLDAYIKKDSAIDLTDQEICVIPNPIEKINSTSVENSPVSVRAKNCLKRHGINTLLQLTEISAEKLSTFQNLGEKTLQEIIAFQNEILEKMKMADIPLETQYSTEILGFLVDFIKEIAPLKLQDNHLKNYLLAELGESCNDKETCYSYWWKESHVQTGLRNYVLHLVKENRMFGLKKYAIMEKLPPALDVELLDGILCELEEEGQLVPENGTYLPVTAAALDILRERAEERYAEMIEKRMEQSTLEEIAEIYSLTRERVRQLQEKALNIIKEQCLLHDLLLTEERFLELYEKYQLSEEEFIALTGENKRTFGYLQLVAKRGETMPEMLVYDESIPQWMRRKWIRYTRNSPNSKYLYIPEENHRRIAKTRLAIEQYILSKYCQDEVSFEQFIGMYNEFIYAYHLEGQGLLTTDTEMRTRENHLSGYTNVLWKQGRKLRYYNIPANDYTELLRALDLQQYHDTELSTLKFFRDHTEIMQQYDIRDEYELHNLLKKIGAESENTAMQFGRTPYIRFGDCDRDRMIREKLFELAPIRSVDLAKTLSDEYGFTIAQMTSWMNCISEYSRNGIYSVDSVPMSEEHIALLKEHLTEEFYFFSEVKEIYRKLVPDADLSLISAYNLKLMGFVVNSNYIIQHHDSAAKLFEHLLTQKDVQDISPLSKRYGGIMSYSQKLAELKDTYDIIEFSPYQYIHFRKLQKMGIEKDDLRKYCDYADKRAEEGEYFTVEYLRNKGFSSPLDELGFDAWFYSSLLREDERFSYTKLGGTVLFFKGKQNISELTFIQELMEHFGAIEMEELLEYLYGTYHISLDKDCVKWNIQNTMLYYDDIMGKLYLNYDVYFEELEAIDDDEYMENEEL